MRLRVTIYSKLLYLVGLDQECPNYSPWVKVDLIPGVTSFTWANIGKTVEISQYLAIRQIATKFCMWLYVVGLYQECPSNSPRVKIVLRGLSQV